MTLAVNDQADGTQYRLGVTLARSKVDVTLAGEIDIATAPKLTRLLESLDRLDLTIVIDLSAVTFIDSTGLLPIVQTAERRQQLGLAPVVIGECSAVGRRLLEITRLGGNPTLDLESWAALGSDEAW